MDRGGWDTPTAVLSLVGVCARPSGTRREFNNRERVPIDNFPFGLRILSGDRRWQFLTALLGIYLLIRQDLSRSVLVIGPRFTLRTHGDVVYDIVPWAPSLI